MASEASAIELRLNEPQRAGVRAGLLTLALFSIGHFFIDLYSSALGVFQPVLGDKLGLSLTEAGMLGGLLIFASSVTQPAYGYLSDRFHSRMFSALAPAVAGIFISSLGLAPSFGWLAVMVLLGGSGIASFHPQASSRATSGISGRRAGWMAVFISSGSLGMAIGPAYFSALLTRAGASRSWWGALPGIAITIVLLAMLPAKPRAIGHPRHRFDLAPLKAVWKPLTVLYLLVFIRSILQIVFTQLLPLFLHRERGFSLTRASLALSLYLTCGAVGGFLGGPFADRFGGRRVILISMAGCLPFLALFFMASGALSLIGLALGGLMLLFTTPVNVVMAQDLVPSQSGTISALMMGFAWGMAGLIFIPLVGWAGDHFTLYRALFSLLVFPVIGIFLTFKLPK
jgi:FSR family fosmidomycin resistance protein-like MFS transporter